MILHKIDKLTGKKVPTERLLFKFGANKTTKGTFYLTEEVAKTILNSWKAYGNKLNIDYSHQQLAEKQTADGSISAGTYDLAIKSDGLYAVNIEWTTRAAKYITDKEYIYTSPAFITELRDGKEVIIEVINFALTNIPATLHMDELLIAASRSLKNYKDNKELTMTEQNIENEIEAVELAAVIEEEVVATDVVATDIVEAAVCAPDEIKEEELADPTTTEMTLEEAMAALEEKDKIIAELKSKLSETEDMPEEMEKLNQKLTKLSADLDTKTKEVIVLSAIHSGKLNPAQKDLYISLDAAKLTVELDKLPAKSVVLNKTVENVAAVSVEKSEVRKLSDYINKRVFGRA